MDRFFVDKKQIKECQNLLSISGDDVKHISKVLRYQEGDKLEVCDCDNNEYICEICRIDKSEVECKIVEKVEIKRESNVKVRLYQGLPKSSKMEIILQKLTESGVYEIVLVNTKRSVVNIDDKKADKKLERWERIIYEAAKQSKRGVIPKLRGVLSFKEALEDMKNNDINISPYECEKSQGIKSVLREEGKKAIEGKDESFVGIFIGPEGGFSEEENDMIKDMGAYSVSLGPRIFRTETASIVSTAITLYELGDIG